MKECFVWLVKHGALAMLAFALLGCGDLRDRLGYRADWTELVVTSQGVNIEVKRTLRYDPPRSNSPAANSLTFTHPDSGMQITWNGIHRGEHPVALDTTANASYLVVLVSGLSLIHWECPKVPYLAYRQELGSNDWKRIEIGEFPNSSPVANLIEDPSRNGIFGYFLPDEIQRANRRGQRKGDYFQSSIPRSIEEWAYEYKNEERRCGADPEDSGYGSVLQSLAAFFIPSIAFPVRLISLGIPSVRRRTHPFSLLFYFVAGALQVGGSFYLWLYGAGVATGYVFMLVTCAALVPFVIALSADWEDWRSDSD